MVVRLCHFFLVALIISSSAVAADTQCINFEDLKRPATHSEKTWSLSGISSEAIGYIQKYGQIDEIRTEQRRAYRSTASSNEGSSSSNSNTSEKRDKPQKTSKTYVCKIYCKSSSGPTIYRETQAANRSEAAEYMGDNADIFCGNEGYGNASKRDFPESQCHEK